MNQYRRRSRYEGLFANVSLSRLLFLPLLPGVGQNLDTVVALDLFMFADITGQDGLFLNMLDMASHYHEIFLVADKNPLTVFFGFFLVGVSRLVFLNVFDSI